MSSLYSSSSSFSPMSESSNIFSRSFKSASALLAIRWSLRSAPGFLCPKMMRNYDIFEKVSQIEYFNKLTFLQLSRIKIFLRFINCESFIVITFVISNIKESRINTKLDEFILCGHILALKPNVWITMVSG